MVSARELWEFEEEVAARFAEGRIKGPVHLNSPTQIEPLQAIFANVRPEDWVLGTWRSHYHALLKGVPRELVMAEVLAGRSMMLHFPSHKFLTSAIVGGILPLACGLAAGGARVWCFVGDMAATTGGFHEALRLTHCRDLSITFIEEDNGLATNTPTEAAWGTPEGTELRHRIYKYQRLGSHYVSLPGGARGF